MKVRRVIPLKLRASEEQKEKIDNLFEGNRKLLSFLTECCKRTEIIDNYELHRIYYRYCREKYHLPAGVIQQQMKQVCATFKGNYKARHIPDIAVDSFPIRLTHGKSHLFYFIFNNGLAVKLSLPSSDGYKKEIIQIHDGKLEEPLTLIEKAKVSDSLLFPDYTLHVVFTKDVKLDYEPETFIGVDFGIRNLLTAVSSTGEILKMPGEPIIEAFKKGVEHRRRKQKLGSKKFTYNDRKVVKDYVYHATNELINFANKFEKPIIILEHLKGLKKRMSYLPHVYSIAPYEKLHEAIINKVGWNEIKFKVVSAKWTSVTCPVCGFISKKNRNKDRFSCLNCEYENDADVVGAINIMRRGSGKAYSSHQQGEEPSASVSVI